MMYNIAIVDEDPDVSRALTNFLRIVIGEYEDRPSGWMDITPR